MSTVDKAALLAATLPQAPVEVPGVGSVIVRSLSRDQVVRLQACPNPGVLENETLAAGMVEPALTVEEAAAWRAVADNDAVKVVSDRILQLSGLVEGSQTDKERRFRAGDD
jgi:hypothetical protein